MIFKVLLKRLRLFVLVCFLSSIYADTQIDISPEITRQIKGISELNRNTYFNLSDDGINIDKRVMDRAMYDYLIHELNIRFGRRLGPVRWSITGDRASLEDVSRPGFADPSKVKLRLNGKPESPSNLMRKDFGHNLDVASHGSPNAYPGFMGSTGTGTTFEGGKKQILPKNTEAAAELAMLVFKYAYNDFTRPRYFEPINEPHWSFSQEYLAQWHLQVKKAFEHELPDVWIGGLCSPVAYMYKEDYRTWEAFRGFIDKTQGKLDFYSFHVYDYLSFQKNDFGGSIQSGLPVDGVLDLVNNYMVNAYGRETPIVISEHGGYYTDRKGKKKMEHVLEAIAQKHFDENANGFSFEMRKRSIVNYNLIRSAVANTMTFMDHPHSVVKAVPFILLQSFNWDPTYYATAYVMHDFNDRSR